MTTSSLTEIDWAEIPAGSTIVGTPTNDAARITSEHADVGVELEWIEKECPQHVVDIPRFSISRNLVTEGQWSEYCQSTGKPFETQSEVLDLPMDRLAWKEADEFCRWISEIIGRTVRLPTEFEWVRSARGDDAREYPWGDSFEASRCNLAESRIGRRTPIGSFPSGASPYGVLDLAGNVDEWTSTIYSPYENALPTVPSTEPWALDRHVTKGGSFRHHRDLARCSRRHGLYPPLPGVGFRIVITE